MKKVFGFLFVAGMISLASCTSNSETTEEAIDSTAVDTVAAVVDTTAADTAAVDSASAVK